MHKLNQNTNSPKIGSRKGNTSNKQYCKTVKKAVMFNKNSFLLTYLQLYSNKTAIFAKVIL